MSTAGSQRASEPVTLIVMGVSGSGKSTIAAQVAGRLGVTYVDGDDLHPAANVAKMKGGTPLSDEDRWPWLDRVGAVTRSTAADHGGCVMACSALRRVYRDRLRAAAGPHVRFVFLDAAFEVIDARLKQRIHHFMPESLLRSQFATLERPGTDEPDVLTVSADQPPRDTVDAIVTGLTRL